MEFGDIKCVRTVGELRDAIKDLDPNMKLDFMACWYDRNNWEEVHRPYDYDSKFDGLEIELSVDRFYGSKIDTLRICNSNPRDLELN